MDRVAVFVDAGYLFAAGSELIAGEKLPRGGLDLDVAGVADFFAARAAEFSGLPLLRIYWYDGTSDGPSAQHTALAYHDNVKVRLGLVNRFGQQKGVDSLIVTDMINLARNHAMASAVLLTGDEDIRVGVQQAQEHGARVHLVGIEPSRDTQSNLLLQEADVTHELDRTAVASFLAVRERLDAPRISVEDGATGDELLEQVVDAVAEDIDQATAASMAADFRAGAVRVPRDIDSMLLRALEAALGARPDEPQKHEARRLLREALLRA